MSADELTPRFGRVALAAFAAHGWTTLEDLARVPRTELAAVHGVGPKALRVLDEELAARDEASAD